MPARPPGAEPLERRARRREDAVAIFRAAVAAVDPERLVGQALSLDGPWLGVAGHRLRLEADSRIRVVGAGKATPAMARAAEAILGERLDGGVITTKYGHALPLTRIRTIEAGHPVPDAAGVEGARQVLACLQGLRPADVVVCLLSGGGSALLPAPAEGLSLHDKDQTTAALLACGAAIDEINTIRKHLSAVKGGRLAQRAAPARVVSLMISDVIGDPVATIASGPTAPDPTTYADCLALLDRYDLRCRVPAAVVAHLEAGAAGQQPETAKDDDPVFAQTLNLVVGNNALALRAARAEAERRGYRPLVLSSRIAGETRPVAAMHAAIAVEVVASGQPLAPPACLISGGETTVTLQGGGKGGRNQEFVLAAAVELHGLEGITVLCCGTDGTDGPTDAAGAVADGGTVDRAADLGLAAVQHLEGHDAYPFFQALDDLVISGPTGTNVMDLRLFLVG